MSRKLKVGLAGYGIVGKRRCECIKKHPSLEMIAVCDQVFPDDISTVDGFRSYKSYKQLLKENLDILIVCLSNDIASEVTILGLKSGLHVFCEKPPGRSVEDIAKVIKVEKEPSLSRLCSRGDEDY